MPRSAGPSTPSPPLDPLLSSDEPAIRYRAMVEVLGRSPDEPEVRATREEIRTCPRVQRMLSLRDADGRIPGHPYNKWTGAHWVLSLLADMGYPPGEASLLPLRDQVYCVWLGPAYTDEFTAASKSASYAKRGVPIVNGRARRCASQQAVALYSTLALGIADERADHLAALLLQWQWPDGGWNCDKRPEACHSSFHESVTPLRALALHAKVTGSVASREAVDRAVEVFLKRRLFRRQRDGKVIHPAMVRLHYPRYYHYDALFGLKVMAEAGYIGDARCVEALDLLESKRLPDGGFPAEGKHYQVTETPGNRGSLVDWGGTSTRQMNPWVTLDALTVLRSAGRG